MTPEEFVQCFRREEDQLLATYLDRASDSPVSAALSALADRLPEQREIIDNILTDVFYHILLSLDGCASMGDIQQTYTIKDEDGAIVCDGSGDIEALAYRYFHETNKT